MVIGILVSFLMASPAVADDIAGVWMTQKKDSKIEITRNPDGTYSGKIIWAQAPHQDYEGTEVMKGVVYNNETGSYTCPWIYDPKMNVTAHARITLNGDTMNVKASKGILNKTEIFTRIRQVSE